ncbi:MAG: DUF6500 family protein [Marinagarivorans sp.]|nr:DUF6500 family protein [Marinagarivorans sp.]
MAKGENVGLSFYAFFANKNDDPEVLMEAAQWWIATHKLDYFEKSVKIKYIFRSIGFLNNNGVDYDRVSYSVFCW